MNPAEMVAQGCRALASAGLTDMVWGHLSLRDPDDPGLTWLKCPGLGLEEIDSGRVVQIDRHGTRLIGTGGVHLEYPIHTEILAARPDVNSVIHCHPRHAIAFGTLDVELLPLAHAGTLFVPPAIARFEATADLIHNQDLGKQLVATLADRNAALMVNHGIVAVGASVGEAVMTAVLLEEACRTQLLAMSAGVPKKWSPDQESLEKRARVWAPSQMNAGWEYWARQADGAAADG